MSYYEDLGTTPDATPEQIKARWRSMCSEYHPDKKGGSVEAMQKINKAYEVLSDPERRARYDATGDAGEQQTIDQEALTMLIGALRQGLDSLNDDPIAYAGQVLDGVRDQLRVHCAGQEAVIKRMEKLNGRLKVKQGENLAQDMVQTRLRDAQTQLANLQRGQQVNTVARGMLTNYSCEPQQFHSMRSPSAPSYFDQLLGLQSRTF